MPANRRQRWTVFPLLLVLLICLCACGQESQSVLSTATPSPEQSRTDSTPQAAQSAIQPTSTAKHAGQQPRLVKTDQWPEENLAQSVPPLVTAGSGNLVTNNEKNFTVAFMGITRDDYAGYIALLLESGFSGTDDGSDAFVCANADGVKVELKFDEAKRQLSLVVKK